ncbi:hypothetical protein [Thermobacillus composti]|uniref:hypothetical protein n=1 Tax=Thermobacillus composti TaxID=377615 RepID=UPI0038CD8A0A
MPKILPKSGAGREVLPDLYAFLSRIVNLSPLFPNGPVDLGSSVLPLPEDGSIPHLPGWRWLRRRI